MKLTTLELCAGAGGQALGLESAGYIHQAAVEIEGQFCGTLSKNRPNWTVINQDINKFDASEFNGIDLLAAGLPCPPFSVAGKQLGDKDERNLFPAALRIIEETCPRAVMIENVRGFLDDVFFDYREMLRDHLKKLGYITGWKLLNASDFGVSQLRPRVAIVALKPQYWDYFEWPLAGTQDPPTVGETLYDLMASRGWRGAKKWRSIADDIAPTIVGGSKKHGGPDLGPTRAKRAWASLGVDGRGVADLPPSAEDPVDLIPKLTVPMVALLQGFPPDWIFNGKKTAAYRQVGNAFPPPVAKAVACQIKKALTAKRSFRAAA